MINKIFIEYLFTLFVILSFLEMTFGQAYISSQAGYIQNFNLLASNGTVGTLVPWNDNITVPGWYAYQSKRLPYGPPAGYYIDDGSFNTGGDGLRSFGTASQSERALGEVSNATDTAVFAMALRLVNSTGSAITSLMVTYRGEQWRQNSGTKGIVFEYQVGATSISSGNWISVPALDFLPLKNGVAGPLDGNAVGNYAVKSAIINVSLNNGQEIWCRWKKQGTFSCGLAIDDLLIQTEPTSQPTNLQFSSITSTSMNISFTASQSASGYIVLQKISSAPTGIPIDGQIYNIRDSIGDATVVSFGSNTSFSAIALLPNSSYYYAIYSYNGNGSTTNYYTINPLTGNQSTLISLASINSDVISLIGSESQSISSLVNDEPPLTTTTGKGVWKFSIRDGGPSGDSDSKPTIVIGLTLEKGLNIGIIPWSNLFLAADLFDENTHLASGTISSSKIDFSNFRLIASDDGSKTISLRVSLKPSGLIDNDSLQFVLSNFNIRTESDTTSSQFAAFGYIMSDSSKNSIDVVATKLRFSQQPTSVALGKIIKPAVAVEATDINNNRDFDYASAVLITATGALLNGEPVSVFPLKGFAQFDSLSFSGTGSSVFLVATSNSLSIQSNIFSVVSFRTFYIDTLGNNNQNGLTPSTAWKSLSKVNETFFEPGDSILFKSGQTWTGQLKPKGSGTADNPIKINSYGGQPKPIMNGGGIIGEAVVYLNNQAYWEISNLEIVNDGASPEDRRGVLITASNYGVINHIYLRNLYIHNIKGIVGDDDAAKRTAGIGIEVTGDLSLPTRFNDVWIDSCTIANIENVGLYIDNLIKRNDYPNTPLWNNRKITNLRITNNVIHHISKNAMIIRLAKGGLIEHNVCYETATGTTGNTMFTASCDGVVFQYNEGYYNRASLQGGDFGDGSMYDADLQSINCIFQYSYSHDNSHGLFWTCTVQQDTGNVCRYNVSKNDKGIIFCINYPVTSVFIYNNTIYTGDPSLSPTYISERNLNPGTRTYSFYNNIIHNLSPNAKPYNLRANGYNRIISNNIFFGYHPANEPADVNKLTSDPMFVDATPISTIGLNSVVGFALNTGSPAINSGLDVPGRPDFDFLGNQVPINGIVDRGAFEYSIVATINENVESANTFWLLQNYPNPFNPETKIAYNLPTAGLVKVSIYDILGGLVANLKNEFQEAGYHEINWNATNEFKHDASSGVYLARITFGRLSKSIKLILAR
jgi:hypothetical protein